MIVGEDNYTWSPNFIKYEDPETGLYKGNVVGNTPLDIQLEMVRTIGQEERDGIENVAGTFLIEMESFVAKYADFSNLISSVTTDILNEFGNVFTLDSSALDSGILT